ncbi:MAG: PucR family transcriptional regulator ligand-binding domain-containing protein [Eubacteriales bacterium]|nr:PucR family transcriptional regulator ligand-binding domain-containing protein [Eubacteriales bacterium]
MITCRHITDLPYANKLTCKAGKTGLNRAIQWVHYLEVPEYVGWLKGQELVIVSGAMIRGSERGMIGLIDQLYDKEVSGVVINLSTYIDHIPESVIRKGDELGLPIFEMPAEVRIVDVSQSICFAIFQDKRKENMYKDILMEAINGKRMTEKRYKLLEKAGFVEGQVYRAVIVQVRKNTVMDEDKPFYDEESLDTLLLRLEDAAAEYFSQKRKTVLHTSTEDYLLLVMKVESESGRDISERVFLLVEWLKEREKDLELKAAIGTEFHTIREIKHSVENALDLLRICRDDKDVVLDYRNHTLERILGELTDTTVLKEVIRGILGPLLEEDQKELLETLRVYLYCGENKKNVAAQLFVHVNTLNYRINKLERMLGQDLSDPQTRFTLELAIRINDYFVKV